MGIQASIVGVMVSRIFLLNAIVPMNERCLRKMVTDDVKLKWNNEISLNNLAFSYGVI